MLPADLGGAPGVKAIWQHKVAFFLISLDGLSCRIAKNARVQCYQRLHGRPVLLPTHPYIYWQSPDFINDMIIFNVLSKAYRSHFYTICLGWDKQLGANRPYPAADGSNSDWVKFWPMSAFLSAGESLTPSPVTATMAPCRWHPSTMMSFCCGDVRANTISEWLASTSSICAGVMSRRSLPCTTHAFASLQQRYSCQATRTLLLCATCTCGKAGS